MTKKKKSTGKNSRKGNAETTVFTFGEPVKVLDNTDLVSNYLRSYHNGRYYEPPVSFKGLYQSQFANTHHLSAIQLKINMLCALFQPSPQLSMANFKKFALNALVMGNGYLEAVPSQRSNQVAFYRPASAMITRRINETQYGYFPPEQRYQRELIPFENEVIHWLEDDLDQEHYGKPYYLPALQAAWLNEDATLFRRRYYLNGNQAGFILYLSDPAHSLDDVKALKQAMKDTKGPGAFRNLFFYAPKGKKDGMQVIPVESATAQDKFFDIKNTSRDDVMAMHRVPPNLLAVQSQNAGGFGNILEARQAFEWNEIVPLARQFMELGPFMAFRMPEGANVIPSPGSS